MLKDLHRPCGVAVRPGGTAARYEVFVAEAARAGSCVGRICAEANGRSGDRFQDAGCRRSVASDRAARAVVSRSGAAGRRDERDSGGDLVRAYELPDDEKVLAAETTSESTSKSDRLDGATCSAMTRSRANEFVPDMLVLAIRDADGHARLMKARVQAGIVGAPQPFGPKDDSELAASGNDQQLRSHRRG